MTSDILDVLLEAASKGESYSPWEASEVVGKNVTTIYNWIRSGNLRAIKTGGRYNIPAEALVERVKAIRNDQS